MHYAVNNVASYLSSEQICLGEARNSSQNDIHDRSFNSYYRGTIQSELAVALPLAEVNEIGGDVYCCWISRIPLMLHSNLAALRV